MTEPTEISAATPTKRKRALWWGALLVVVLVGGAFLASRAGLDKALVKQQLDNFIASAKQQARERGRQLDITYGDLKVAGGLANKHVEVMDVVVKVKPLHEAAPVRSNSSLVVTTSLLNVFPTAADLSSLRIELPQPIDFAAQDAPEKSLMKITSASAPTIAISSENEGEVTYHKTSYHVPESLNFTYLREQQAQGQEDAAPQLTAVYETLKMQVVGAGEIETRFAQGSDLGSVRLAFGKITLTPEAAPEGAITIAALNGAWSNSLSPQKQNVMQGTLNFGPLEAPEGLIPFAPVALNLDASYTGAMPQNAAAVASIESQESKMQLKNFSFTLKGAGIKAAADFAAHASDVLPVGTAKIDITNLPYLLDQMKQNHFINPAQEALVSSTLPQMTGKTLAETKDASIAIERVRGGAFKVGNTTFEELFATFLKTAMMYKAQAAPNPAEAPAAPASPAATSSAPQLLPSDKPKPDKIPVPDPSVRG